MESLGASKSEERGLLLRPFSEGKTSQRSFQSENETGIKPKKKGKWRSAMNPSDDKMTQNEEQERKRGRDKMDGSQGKNHNSPHSLRLTWMIWSEGEQKVTCELALVTFGMPQSKNDPPQRKHDHVRYH